MIATYLHAYEALATSATTSGMESYPASINRVRFLILD
jgi:hypothetical protein